MTERAYITFNREQWKNLHNALCAAEQGRRDLQSVRDALAPAYEQDNTAFSRQWEYFDETRNTNGFRATWSLYDEVGVGEFDQPHPYIGATHVVYDQHWGTTNETQVPIAGNTWLDLYRAANEVIQASGDNHHIFIERFDPVEDKLGYLSLVTGS